RIACSSAQLIRIPRASLNNAFHIVEPSNCANKDASRQSITVGVSSALRCGLLRKTLALFDVAGLAGVWPGVRLLDLCRSGHPRERDTVRGLFGGSAAAFPTVLRMAAS